MASRGATRSGRPGARRWLRSLATRGGEEDILRLTKRILYKECLPAVTHLTQTDSHAGRGCADGESLARASDSGQAFTGGVGPPGQRQPPDDREHREGHHDPQRTTRPGNRCGTGGGRRRALQGCPPREVSSVGKEVLVRPRQTSDFGGPGRGHHHDYSGSGWRHWPGRAALLTAGTGDEGEASIDRRRLLLGSPLLFRGNGLVTLPDHGSASQVFGAIDRVDHAARDPPRLSDGARDDRTLDAPLGRPDRMKDLEERTEYPHARSMSA